MLEASGFDFRSRHPQMLTIKLARACGFDRIMGKTAYYVCIDLYRTFAPLKQTVAAMAIASVELAARLHNEHVAAVVGEDGIDYKRWHITRPEVMGKP